MYTNLYLAEDLENEDVKILGDEEWSGKLTSLSFLNKQMSSFRLGLLFQRKWEKLEELNLSR